MYSVAGECCPRYVSQFGKLRGKVLVAMLLDRPFQVEQKGQVKNIDTTIKRV